MAKNSSIQLKGVRVNNLKNIDLDIPRNKMIVVTGLSGSGKSSLAFDTLYAEGQRRYVESLSSYARQFLGRMEKPECDYIKGIPPAIAIEQKVNTSNPRSTVGTSTEIYEYLRLLYARVGRTISPISGNEVKRSTTDDVLTYINTFAVGTRWLLLSPFLRPAERTEREHLEVLMREGFSRVEHCGASVMIEELLASESEIDASQLYLLVDRLVVSHEKIDISRATDSIETAFYEGKGEALVRVMTDSGTVSRSFSVRFELDGITFLEPTEYMFNFNNPMGACPLCEGFGRVMGIDENLIIPNKGLSLYDGAVACWRGDISKWHKQQFIAHADEIKFPIHRPYAELTKQEREMLWHGVKGVVKGIDDFFDILRKENYKIQNRVMIARFSGKTTCPECNGSRLRTEALYVKVGGKSIDELVTMDITTLHRFFETLELTPYEHEVAKRILLEIDRRLDFLLNVGLPYLTLDRPSATLSGGESQRINLSTSLSSSLVGSLYILDEPSIGLHPRDTHLLIDVLRNLQRIGNTVIVVEHDEEIMRQADWIIDIGPLAGAHGGEVVYSGAASLVTDEPRSLTGQYLAGSEMIKVPHRRRWNQYIEIHEAWKHNLKGVTARFPLKCMTVVTGVSGSGKSTLVREIFYEAVKRLVNDHGAIDGLPIEAVTGDYKLIKGVEYVDQNPIGRSSRSNPVTYVKAYDDIRQLFASQKLSKQMGFIAGHFSFNAVGGRCEQCKGDGKTLVPMQFMADLELVCEECHGKRFKKEVLEVTYKGKNIYEVLEMTIQEAITFFAGEGNLERRILQRLKPLIDVGLGYVKMGQSSSTLSGGESQRVKLAYFLGEGHQDATLFIFDEPTTGLHFHDIKTLLGAFDALVERGHTLVVIEHNLEVIKCADHIIDIGPEAGSNGGTIVATGTPEEIIQCDASHTARFLRDRLAK